MKRRLYHFKDLIADKIEYYHVVRAIDNNGVKGVIYHLCNNLTEEQKEKLSKYDNVRISECYMKYAPEIKHDVLFITE